MAERYWVSSDASGFSSSNWSNESGGSSGASVPGEFDNVYFDGNGVGDCVFDTSVEVQNFNLQATYPGLIDQGINSLTIYNATFSGGRFLGGSGPIYINGTFSLLGTDFTSTGNILYVSGDYSCLSASYFYHNYGRVYSYNTNKHFNPNDSTFYDLEFINPTGERSIVEVITESTPDTGLYEWAVTGPTSSNCIIKYSGVRNIDVVAFSSPFSIGPDSNYSIGSILPIRWNTLDFYYIDENDNPQEDSVKLELLRDSTSVSGYQVLDSSFYVKRNLYLIEGNLIQGIDSTTYALGNVYCNSGYDTSTIPLCFTGTEKQNLFSNGGMLSTVYVNKPTSNQVRVYGSSPVYLNGDFFIFDGTFNTNGHDIIQYGNVRNVEPAPIASFTWALDIVGSPAPTVGLKQWFKLEDNGNDALGGNPLVFMYGEAYQNAVVNRGFATGGIWLEPDYHIRKMEFYFHTPANLGHSGYYDENMALVGMDIAHVMFLYRPSTSIIEMWGWYGDFLSKVLVWTSDPITLAPNSWSGFKYEYDGDSEWNIYIKTDAFSPDDYVKLNTSTIVYSAGVPIDYYFGTILNNWMQMNYPDGFDEIKTYSLDV